MRTVFLATSETYEDDFIAVAFALESADVTTRGELLDLARKAVRLYALTDDGMIDFENSSYGFDWGDLMDHAEEKTFRDICDKLGLRCTCLGRFGPETRIEYDEFLMSDIPVGVENIQWDTDGESVDDLPSATTVLLPDPSKDIADALSDEYGYCVLSYTVADCKSEFED